MFKAAITAGPDRLSIFMALGSYHEQQPMTPEFTVVMSHPNMPTPLTEKIGVTVRSVSNTDESPDTYVIEGKIVPDSQALEMHHVTLFIRMVYDTAARTGNVFFFIPGEEDHT
jgi:hypothetical protein